MMEAVTTSTGEDAKVSCSSPACCEDETQAPSAGIQSITLHSHFPMILYHFGVWRDFIYCLHCVRVRNGDVYNVNPLHCFYYFTLLHSHSSVMASKVHHPPPAQRLSFKPLDANNGDHHSPPSLHTIDSAPTATLDMIYGIPNGGNVTSSPDNTLRESNYVCR